MYYDNECILVLHYMYYNSQCISVVLSIYEAVEDVMSAWIGSHYELIYCFGKSLQGKSPLRNRFIKSRLNLVLRMSTVVPSQTCVPWSSFC